MAIAEKSPLPVGDTTTLSFIYTETGNPVPADKKLDISVLGGSDGENGYLTAGGITDISFGGVTQPIQYIAPLSITGDSLVVPIRASLSVGGGIPMKIRKDDSVKTSSVKINKMMSRTMSVCENGSVTVENKQPCADAPQCPALFEKSPIMMVQPQPNGFQGRDVCSSADDLGGFQNIVGSFTPIIVDPCYNMQSEGWRFPIMNVIEINVILDICRDNIENKRKQKLIKSVDEVVPADSILALQDFRDHYPPHIYPAFPSREGGYVLEEVLWLHEKTHKYHYELIIAEKRDSLFDNVYQGLRYSCETVKNIDEAKEKIEKCLNTLMKILTIEVNKEWVKKLGQGQAYEVLTHSSVKPLVEYYIRELQNKYNVK
ncbi:MAG: hypothetical protein JXA06_00245 [Bacteroidetes bacterium]|nr:hypothetical protein [Bacteroidota bacterium]